MECIYCGEKTQVVNSRKSLKSRHIWRRRKCPGCQAVFTTDEHADMYSGIRVRTGSNKLMPFISEKIYLEVYESLSHRKTAYTDAKGLTATIITRLVPCRSGVLEINEINQSVSDVLKRFDKAAYTYYRAHHPAIS